MKKQLLLIIALLLTKITFAQIDLASGGSGSLSGVPQSFNETRGVDVQVLSASSLTINSMTLGGFYSGITGTETAYVGARIYNSSTGALLAYGNDTVTNTAGGSVTVPVSFTFLTDSIYRVSFYCSGPNPPTHNSGYLFLPTSVPYTEATNNLKILAMYAYPADVMPTNMNLGVPLITLNTVATGIHEITTPSTSIYPNPFTEQTTVTFNELQINTTITITNMLGKEIKSIHLSGKEVIIERAAIYPGMYLMVLTDEKKNKVTKKIIIQ